MKCPVSVALLILCILCVSGCVTETSSGTFSDQDKSEANALINDLREKARKENEVMELIEALQNDPKMQEVLNDPAAMNAVLFMDMNFIENDPRLKNLRNNPRMREILKRLNQ